ncbi:MAG: GNAT family N-acetyltransferase [Spirochaetia bacterium]|jgi:RimJ/RimL family protein N-acetyltransferase
MITIADIQRKYIHGFQSALDSVSREKKYLIWTAAPPLAEVRAFVTGNIGSGNPQIVALDDGKVVGWCDIIRNTRATKLHCGLLGMGLLPEYRGKGIGTRLITEIMKQAAARGFHRVELEVFEENSAALALYRKVGFKEEGRKSHAVKIEGKYFNVVMMAIIL